MHYVEAEPSTAVRTSGCEKRIENVTLNFAWNAAAVIRESDLDLPHAKGARPDEYVSAAPVSETVNDGVEDKVGQHLPVRTRVAAQRDAGGNFDRNRLSSRFWQAGPYAGHDLLGHKLQVKSAPIGMAAIGGNLLERLNEVPGPLEICDKLVCTIATTFSELSEHGTAYFPGSDLLIEVRNAVCER